ncbi:Gfo/Idh/MocA family protein [Tropicimonas sp. IMCC34011]|uniref:Gfo/Idh/MocA family protein n=1 Tax=Tropicimonas sp. IMCC34011 TaxID=2248759 RepID=UPI000E25DDFF|nr:Gfo/Idh/MocA family oxidoreductase [Tropicimonas sp. IMCC34011]
MSRLRIGIVGCGWVAGSQVERGFSQLMDLFEVTACCDRTPDKAAAFAAAYGIPATTPDYDALLARDDVDVVSICTPPSLHHEMIVAALEAGKHAISEKPLTSSLALTDDLIRREGNATSRVMPIFQYRFGPGLSKIRALLRSDLPGRAFVSSVETAWKRGADYYEVPWRGKFATELGGVLLTQAIHIHDIFLDLRGDVAAVNAFRDTRVNPIEVEDCAVASLKMADGSLATLTATLGSMRPVTRLRFCFENLTVERQCFDAEAPKPGLDPWTVIGRTPEIEAKAKAIMAAAPDTGTDFEGQFRDFHAAIEGGRPFAVSLSEARRSMELVTALFHASSTGTQVALPIGPEHPLYEGWVPTGVVA